MATQAIAAPVIGGLGRGTEWVAEHNALLLAAQRRGRRGPTPEALFPKRIDNSRLVKAIDAARGREMRSFAYAMAFLLSLIMVYGWQHFSAIECGYRIETEKQQLADPERIDAMARNLGLSAPHPGQVVHPNAAGDANTPAMAENHPAVPAVH